MKISFYHHFFIHLIIIFSSISIINTQSQCHIARFPEVIPMLYGQQTTINLQEYFTGPNITFTVQPNDFHSNIQPQYSCKPIWNHQLGKIISTQTYQIKLNNKTQSLISMLGGSSYFNDVYFMYYGINISQFQSQTNSFNANENIQVNRQQQILKENNQQTDENININALQADNIFVIELPRFKLKDCKQFNTISNNTHLQFIIDCNSISHSLNKILVTTIVPIDSPTANPQWKFIQTPIYLPEQMIPKLHISSQISTIQTSTTMKYLVRTIMNQHADYIQIWRWTNDSKQIVNLYDTSYFINQQNVKTNDFDLRMIQVISNTILVLDLMNGLHIVRLSNTGQLIYRSNLQIDSFPTFHYDSKQQLLFLGKRGQIQQYEVKILSQTNIKANRIQRYHLQGFQDINQITVQNRFVYITTNQFIHVIHLTNIPSNDQYYDGSYNIYPELYSQKLIPTNLGFIKIVASQSIVQASICETHPPFLHLKTPQSSNNFTVIAHSTLNGVSTLCSLPLTSIMVIADDDVIYSNGYQAENQTIFSNRPGTTLVDLQKYGIGKNIDYDLLLFKHQIPFIYKVRKVNNQTCELVNSKYQNSKVNQTEDEVNERLKNLQANSTIKTLSIGQWLIIDHPQDRVKQFYMCYKYQKISCKHIQLYITSSSYIKSSYQLIEQQKTKKQYIQQAALFLSNNQSMISVILISQDTQPNDTNDSNLKIVNTLCQVKFPLGAQYQVGDFKLKKDKLYVVLPHLKQVRVYEALLSFQQDQQCHYFGNINASSFTHPSIYFTPQNINFDKQALGILFQVPSFAFQQQKLQLISLSSQIIFLSQFNQILVVRLTIGSDFITRIQLLKSIVADRIYESDNISLMVVLPYVLVIDQTQKAIAQYYFTHTFDAYFIRFLDFWSTNTNQNHIKLVDSNTIAVMTAPDSLNESYAQVYSLTSIVTSFKQFARWKITGPFQVMTFVSDEYQFVTVSLRQTTTSTQMYCNSTTLTPDPYLYIDIPKRTNDDEPSKQQFYLNLFTELDSKRHIMTLEVASDSSQIENGLQYPYKPFRLRIEQDDQQAYFEIDDRKWFQGNIWSHRYVCDDCKTGRIRFDNKISLQSKIQLQSFNIPSDFYVHKRQISQTQNEYTFDTIEGYLNTKMIPQNQNQTQLIEAGYKQTIQTESIIQTNKISYTFSESLILSSNIQNDPDCIKASPQGHELYFLSLCEDYQFLDDTALLELRLYSSHGFKPSVISEYAIELTDLNLHQIKASTKSQKQLIIIPASFDEQQESTKYDTVFVRFGYNIWVFLILNGKLQLIYTVDKVDFGDDHLCWMQIIRKNVSIDLQSQIEGNNQKTRAQYGIMASMCEKGLYYIVFTIDPPKHDLMTQKDPIPSFHRLTEQHINMQVQLQKNKIQLPQRSYFLQTIVKSINNQSQEFLLYMIVENFNSFIWKVSLLKETIAVSSMSLVGVIRRYNEYSPIQVTSNDDRYFTVLYKSTQNVNVSQFLAVYDIKHFVYDEDKQMNLYNMFSVEKTNESPVHENKSQVFQIGPNLFVLTQNNINIFNVTNLIRMHVQKKIPIKTVLNENNQENKEENKSNKKIQLQSQNASSKDLLLNDEEDPILYSQSIIIFVQTPTEVNSVTIKLDSIDFFQLSGWYIALIVIGGIIILVILYYSSRQLWRYYQKKRKLVKLETDQLDDHSSSRGSQDKQNDQDQIDEEQAQVQNINDRTSQITTSDNPFGQSILVNQERESLITTSDSPSILQSKDIQQPLIEKF